jgi:flagellar biosynthesis component FlhA
MNEIELEIGYQLFPLVVGPGGKRGGKLLEGISRLRKERIFPPVRICDNVRLLKENEYRFIIDGKEVFRGECKNIFVQQPDQLSQQPDQSSRKPGRFFRSFPQENEKNNRATLISHTLISVAQMRPKEL